MAIVERVMDVPLEYPSFGEKFLAHRRRGKGVVTSMMKRITGVVLKLTAKKRIKLSGTA